VSRQRLRTPNWLRRVRQLERARRRSLAPAPPLSPRTVLARVVYLEPPGVIARSLLYRVVQ